MYGRVYEVVDHLDTSLCDIICHFVNELCEIIELVVLLTLGHRQMKPCRAGVPVAGPHL